MYTSASASVIFKLIIWTSEGSHESKSVEKKKDSTMEAINT